VKLTDFLAILRLTLRSIISYISSAFLKLESPFLADLFLLGGAGSHQLSIDLPCLFRNEFLVIKGVNSPLLQSKESSAVSVAYNLIRCTFAGQYVEVAF
jgi:hypothetical protein